MGIYSDNKDYQKLIKNNIELANILNSTPVENQNSVIALLNKKQEIIEKNGIFASFQLDSINKKINKLMK